MVEIWKLFFFFSLVWLEFGIFSLFGLRFGIFLYVIYEHLGCRFWCLSWEFNLPMSERKTIDLEQGWDFMQKGITKLKNTLEGLPEPQFRYEDNIMLYTYASLRCFGCLHVKGFYVFD